MYQLMVLVQLYGTRILWLIFVLSQHTAFVLYMHIYDDTTSVVFYSEGIF